MGFLEDRKPIIICGALLIIVFTLTNKLCLAELVVVVEAIAIFFTSWNMNGSRKPL